MLMVAMISMGMDGIDDGDEVNLTNPHPRIAIWGAILRVGNSE